MKIFLSRYLLFLLPLLGYSQIQAQQISPPNGALVVVGGGRLDPSILDRFMELAGGPESPIVLIPTAGASDDFGDDFYGLQIFKERGASHLTLLHTRDRNVANADSFVQAIHEASGVWFSGGRQWRLADSYLDTKTEEALWNLLDRGGVIGGSSAGATIQGSYLARGDTKTNVIMMGDHEEGFGFLKNTTIDQHHLRRNRQWDLLQILDVHPELLGIGIDENTAIVVQHDWFEVIGASYVAVYDRQFTTKTNGAFYLLRSGDMYHLPERSPYRNDEPMVPFEMDTQ